MADDAKREVAIPERATPSRPPFLAVETTINVEVPLGDDSVLKQVREAPNGLVCQSPLHGLLT